MSNNTLSKFWFFSAPDLRTSLVYVAASMPRELGAPSEGAELEETALALSFFDCDGELTNQATIEFPTKRQCFLEMNSFLGNVKRQAGFAHGLVTVSGCADVSRLLIRFQSSHASWLHTNDTVISRNKPYALPVYIGENRRGLIVITNTDDTEVTVRGRLLLGKRSPESSWTLTARSSRIIDLAGTFAEVIGEAPSSMHGRGYLRLSTSSDAGVLTHLMLLNTADDGTETLQVY